MALRRRVASMPSISGIRTSISTTSGASVRTISIAWVTGRGLPDDLEVTAVQERGQGFPEPVVVVHDEEAAMAVHGGTCGAPDRLHALKDGPGTVPRLSPAQRFPRGDTLSVALASED